MTHHIIRLAEAVTITPRTDIEVVRLVEAVKAHGPQIVRTVEELEALDPVTHLIDRDGEIMTADEWLGSAYFPMDETDRLAVFATGEQIRAALKALEVDR